MKHAVIVGSGLAGLTAGFRLQEQGWRITVLESEDRAGGRVMSLTKGDFLLDVGPTLITDKYTEYLKLVNDVGLSHLVVDSSALIGVVSGRELHLFDAARPLASFVATKALSTGAKLKLIARAVRLVKPLWKINPYDLRDRVRYDSESMESYLNRVFGRALNESFLGAVARGMTLSTTEDASVLEFFAGATAASGKMQNIKGGLDVLPRALAKTLDVRLNSPVTAVRQTNDGVEVDYRDPLGAFVQQQADACVITARFTDAAQLYPPLKEAGADLLRATDYLGCYSLQLMYDQRTAKEPFIIMVPESASPEVCAVFLEHVKSPDRAPVGKSHFTLFYNLSSGIDFARWSDERLTETARTFVESLFPELDGHFLASHLTRWAYAAHKGSVGYYKALDAFLKNHPADDPVQVAGDYMSVAGQESAVVAGVNAVRRILNR
jgi:protoporphyrinogen oxidase